MVYRFLNNFLNSLNAAIYLSEHSVSPCLIYKSPIFGQWRRFLDRIPKSSQFANLFTRWAKKRTIRSAARYSLPTIRGKNLELLMVVPPLMTMSLLLHNILLFCLRQPRKGFLEYLSCNSMDTPSTAANRCCPAKIYWNP